MCAIEWDDYQSSLCSGCGQPQHETFDPTNVYEAEGWTCFACQARDAETRAVQEAISPPGGGEPTMGRSALDGAYFAVKRLEV